MGKNLIEHGERIQLSSGGSLETGIEEARTLKAISSG